MQGLAPDAYEYVPGADEQKGYRNVTHIHMYLKTYVAVDMYRST